MTRANPLRVWKLVPLLCLVAGCGARPHILLITLDTTRADYLGCGGRAEASTPTLDSLASEGTRFTKAYTPVPLTLPAHASLFTGRFPWEHGVRDNGLYALGDSLPVLAALLSDAGYWCAAIIGAQPLRAQYGLARGFVVYDDAVGAARHAFDYPERPAFEVTERALAALSLRPKGHPVFLWVHYFDPHAPYAAPRGKMTGYDVEIARMDTQIGRLIRGLPEGRWLVVAVADHGEGLGEHGEQTHGDFLYRTTLHVPLIIAGSSWKRGVTVDTPVTLVDLFPTILKAAGVRPPPSSGVDLHRSIPSRPILAETLHPLVRYGWPPLRSVERGAWKLIQGERVELYRADADPREGRDESRAFPDTVAALLALVPPLGPFGQVMPLGPHDLEALAALGYFSDQASLAPREELLAMIDKGNKLAQERRFSEAVRWFEAVVRSDPGNLWARMGVGTCHAGMGNPAKADSVFRSVLDTHPSYLPALQNLAMVRLMAGDDAEAERLHSEVLALMPGDLASLEALAVCLRRQKKFEESLSVYERLATAKPYDAIVLRDMGSLLAYELNRREEAIRVWRRALALDPRLPQRREMEREMQRWQAARR